MRPLGPAEIRLDTDRMRGRPRWTRLVGVTTQEVDDYLARVPEPGRSALEALRRSILAAAPDAEQVISYGMPAFKVDGSVVAGFAAFKKHLSYLPHSGQVLADVADQVGGYAQTPGSLHFSADEPLPDALVRALVDAKLRRLGPAVSS
jgi:uncharacterized protein YdhG (YjbR/CyaY superfamily)